MTERQWRQVLANSARRGPEGLFAATVPAQMPGEVHDDQDRGDVEEAAR